MSLSDNCLALVRKYGKAAKVVTCAVLNVVAPGSGTLINLAEKALDVAQDRAKQGGGGQAPGHAQRLARSTRNRETKRQMIARPKSSTQRSFLGVKRIPHRRPRAERDGPKGKR